MQKFYPCKNTFELPTQNIKNLQYQKLHYGPHYKPLSAKQVATLKKSAIKKGYTQEQLEKHTDRKYGVFSILDARLLLNHLQELEGDGNNDE